MLEVDARCKKWLWRRLVEKNYYALNLEPTVECLKSPLSYNVGSNNLEISGYNLIQSDHLLSNKRGGVCIYYKNILSLRILNIQYLFECISQEKFQTFFENLQLNLESLVQRNLFLVAAIGDFNAKSNTLR